MKVIYHKLPRVGTPRIRNIVICVGEAPTLHLTGDRTPLSHASNFKSDAEFLAHLSRVEVACHPVRE